MSERITFIRIPVPRIIVLVPCKCPGKWSDLCQVLAHQVLSILEFGKAVSCGFLAASSGSQPDALAKLKSLSHLITVISLGHASILNSFSLDKSPIDKLHVDKLPHLPNICHMRPASITVLKKKMFRIYFLS